MPESAPARMMLQKPEVVLPAGAIIKPCPCCGAEAKIEVVFLYGTPAIRIKCPKCYMQHAPVQEGLHLFYGGREDVSFTFEEAIQKSLDIWNRRYIDSK